MAKYISLKDALDTAFTGCGLCMEPLKDLETVEIIRCKDCKNCDRDTIFNQYWCDGKEVLPDNFCGYAEEKEDADGT